MSPGHPPDAFAGTARYYARYRGPYPPELIRNLVRHAGPTGQGTLLDLACGPGRVAFALADSFSAIRAIDREPEMVEVGKEEAAQLGVHNIHWIVGRAEELSAPPGSFDMVTIGEAFHRLDQPLVARQTMEWLQPGCCLAVLSNCALASDWEPWQRVLASTVHKWTGRAVSTGGVSTADLPGSGLEHTEQVLRDAGFRDVVSYEFGAYQEWTFGAILGNLYSLSVSPRRILDIRAAAFEADLAAALLAHDPSRRYHEMLRFGYTLGRKPIR